MVKKYVNTSQGWKSLMDIMYIRTTTGWKKGQVSSNIRTSNGWTEKVEEIWNLVAGTLYTDHYWLGSISGDKKEGTCDTNAASIYFPSPPTSSYCYQEWKNCSVCGATKSSSPTNYGHNLANGEWQKVDDNYHAKTVTCSREQCEYNYTTEEEHAYEGATCSVCQGTCNHSQQSGEWDSNDEEHWWSYRCNICEAGIVGGETPGIHSYTIIKDEGKAICTICQHQCTHDNYANISLGLFQFLIGEEYYHGYWVDCVHCGGLDGGLYVEVQKCDIGTVGQGKCKMCGGEVNIA